MSRTVQIFDRPCCGPSPAAALADYLRGRLPEIEIGYHDLNDHDSRAAVPRALVEHLIGGGELPVLAVDGRIVAAGDLPAAPDAEDLATGRTAAPPPSSRLPAGSGRC